MTDVAHVSAVELHTPVLDDSVRFFAGHLGLEEVGRQAGSVYLHAWDDYETFTVKLTEHRTAGVGRTWLRARSADALARRVAAVQSAGLGGEWNSDEPGYGPVFHFVDPDGHPYGLYWRTTRYEPSEATRPALRNQAARLPVGGANVRRLDHVHLLAERIAPNERFLADVLGARGSEQIVDAGGSTSAVWYSVGGTAYDLAYSLHCDALRGRLRHVAFAADSREDVLHAADLLREAGVGHRTTPHPREIKTFSLYVDEPGGNGIELRHAGARPLLAPDHIMVTWAAAEPVPARTDDAEVRPYGMPPVVRPMSR
jgi:catechol 2,3-dioxygenase